MKSLEERQKERKERLHMQTADTAQSDAARAELQTAAEAAVVKQDAKEGVTSAPLAVHAKKPPAAEVAVAAAVVKSPFDAPKPAKGTPAKTTGKKR